MPKPNRDPFSQGIELPQFQKESRLAPPSPPSPPPPSPPILASLRKISFMGTEIMFKILPSFVEEQLREKLEKEWVQKVEDKFKEIAAKLKRIAKQQNKPSKKPPSIKIIYEDGRKKIKWDLLASLHAINEFWADIFKHVLKQESKTRVKAVKTIRNKVAHQELISLQEAEYGLESQIHLAKDVDADEDDINELEKLRPLLDNVKEGKQPDRMPSPDDNKQGWEHLIENIRPIEELGDLKYTLGRYDETIEHYAQIIDKLEDCTGEDSTGQIELARYKARIYTKKGNAQAKQGDNEGTVKDFDKALEHDPNNAETYYHRGYAKLSLGDNEGAIQDFDQALELEPNYAETYLIRGYAKVNLKNYEGAIQDYTQAITLDPNLADAYNNRGITKAELKDYRGVIEDFDKAIEIEPNYAEAYIGRGYTKNQLEDYRGAIKDYDKAIEIDPTMAPAYFTRGYAKAGLKDYRGAIEDFTQAIELNFKDAQTYYNRGYAKYLLKDYQGAIEDFDKAIELDPNLAYAYRNRGLAKKELKDYQGAIEDYTQAIEIDPNSAYAYRQQR